jgi:hypothetical protein
MLAKTRESRNHIMLKSDLNPPHTGPNADPVLYGVAAALETLFPPVVLHAQEAAQSGNASTSDEDGETSSLK